MSAFKQEEKGFTTLLDAKLLNPSTITVNRREEIVKNVLLGFERSGIVAWYGFYTLRMPGSEQGWEVDFATNILRKDGARCRMVVIEPHDSFDKKRVEKISIIRDTYDLFVILISKKLPPMFKEGVNHDVRVSDLYWRMPNNLSDKNRVKEEADNLRRRLANFIADINTQIISKEEAKQMLADRINMSKDYENAFRKAKR